MKSGNLVVREATPSDTYDVYSIIRSAFGSEEEVQLVRGLLIDASAEPVLSLLAVQHSEALGHVLFSRARLESGAACSISLLAPLAVVPKAQNRGVGTRLVTHGLHVLAQSGTEMVFVLGHSSYYPRFGFKPAGVLGFQAPYPIPARHADAWMVKFLQADPHKGLSGRIRCADTLDRPEYWRE